METRNINKTLAQWEDLQTFEDDNLAVQVRKLPLPHPEYSMTILAKTPAGKLTPNVHAQLQIVNGVVDLYSLRRRIDSLIERAEQAALTDAQASEDAFMDAKILREQRRDAKIEGGSADQQRAKIKQQNGWKKKA